MEKVQGAPVSLGSEAAFNQALACALAWGREDYVSILYLCRRAGLRLGECFSLSTEAAAQAVKEQRISCMSADSTPHAVELDGLLTARLKRDLTVAVPGRALYLAPGQRAEDAEQELRTFLRDCSITWEEGERDD